MTKIEALEKSLEMWNWIADTGKDKVEYFSSIGTKPDDVPLNGCYLCEYCAEYHKDGFNPSFIIHCENCPVIWSTNAQKEADGIYCESGESPYRKWCRATRIEEKKYASEVADKIRVTLDMEKSKNG